MSLIDTIEIYLYRKSTRQTIMTKKIEKNKKRFNDLLLATNRTGIEYIFEELENIGFYEAPASGCSHLNVVGGLLAHSLNVYDEAMDIARFHNSVRPELKTDLQEDSIAIAALLHDVCKSDNYQLAYRSKKQIDGSWQKYECFEAGHTHFPCGHGEKSVILLLKWGLELKDEEMLAIRWHMGPWDLAFNSIEQTKSMDRSTLISPLVGIIQCADFLATKILENKFKEN